MKLKPFAFIIINTFYIIIQFWIFFYKYALQTATPNAEFTRRLYIVHAARSQRAHGALEDTTALPQRALKHAVETPSRGVSFEHAQNKRRHMAF